MSERYLVDRLVGEDRVARAGPAGSKREEQKKGGVQGEREIECALRGKEGRRLQVNLTCRGVRRDSRWELLLRREISGVFAQRSGSRAGFL